MISVVFFFFFVVSVTRTCLWSLPSKSLSSLSLSAISGSCRWDFQLDLRIFINWTCRYRSIVSNSRSDNSSTSSCLSSTVIVVFFIVCRNFCVKRRLTRSSWTLCRNRFAWSKCPCASSMHTRDGSAVSTTSFNLHGKSSDHSDERESNINLWSYDYFSMEIIVIVAKRNNKSW